MRSLVILLVATVVGLVPISASAQPAGVGWLEGPWNVAYYDEAIGVVTGRAELKAVADGIAGDVVLQEPRYETDHTLSVVSASVAGGVLTLTLRGASPPSQYRKNLAAFDAAVKDAQELPIRLGGVQARVDGGVGRADVVPDYPPLSAYELRVELKIPASGGREKLEGTWSWAVDNEHLMRHGRAGEYRAAAKRAVGTETWTRPLPYITAVADVDLPPTSVLERRQATRTVRGTTRLTPERVALEQAYGTDAYAVTWLRIDGVDLPVGPHREVALQFRDDKVVWTKRHRASRDKPGALEVEVILKKGIRPGPKILTLNGADAEWGYASEPDHVRFVRAASETEFIDLDRLYLGAEFYVELAYDADPDFTSREVALKADGVSGDPVTVTATKVKPSLFRTGPLLVIASSDAEPAGAAHTFVRARMRDELAAFEAETPEPSQGKYVATIGVEAPPASLWTDALARARSCREQADTVREVSNIIVTELSRRTTRISEADHAAAILLRDELVATLGGYIADESARLSPRLSQRRRLGAANDLFTAELIATRGRILSRPIWSVYVPAPDGSGPIPLSTALGERMERVFYGGDKAKFGAFARQSVLLARAELLKRAQESLRIVGEASSCDIVRLLQMIRGGIGPIANTAALKLVRPRNASEAAVPAVVPDAAAIAHVRHLQLLAEAVAAQQEYSSVDTSAVVAVGSAPFIVGGVSMMAMKAGVSGWVGGSVARAAVRVFPEKAVETVLAGGALGTLGIDLAYIGRDTHDYIVDARKEVTFAEGLVTIGETSRLEEARLQAEGARFNVAMSWLMLAGPAVFAKGVVGATRTGQALADLRRLRDFAWNRRGDILGVRGATTPAERFALGEGIIYEAYTLNREGTAPLTRAQQVRYLDEVRRLAEHRARGVGGESLIQRTRGNRNTAEGLKAALEGGGTRQGLLEMGETFFHFRRRGVASGTQTDRVYLNVPPEHAMDVMRFVVNGIVDDLSLPGVTNAKIVGPTYGVRRTDSIVIYTANPKAQQAVVQRLLDYQRRHPRHFRQDSPLMTRRVAPGIAVGAEPTLDGFNALRTAVAERLNVPLEELTRPGRSFGDVRSTAHWLALHDVRAAVWARGGRTHWTDRALFERRLRHWLEQGQVNPDRPHENLVR